MGRRNDCSGGVGGSFGVADGTACPLDGCCVSFDGFNILPWAH